jgi:hypothetical protein
LLRDAAELPAPENTYQLTSVTAPEVSGIVALLLAQSQAHAREPSPNPDGERARGVRREASVTTVSARGLVDPLKPPAREACTATTAPTSTSWQP